MRATPYQIDSLATPLAELRRRAFDLERSMKGELTRVHPDQLASARNLLHYLALRQSDLRPLQAELASLGLSSLGRMEPHALATLDAVLWAVHSLGKAKPSHAGDLEVPCDFVSGPARLSSNAHALLGPEPFRRPVRIMVTMPSEAASDPRLVRDLVASGMDVMRINCAHDDLDAWKAMIGNLRKAERTVGRTCKVYADLPGPKLRTGRAAASVRVLKLRVERDARGRVVRTQQVWLTPSDRGELPPETISCTVPLDHELLQRAAVGDALEVQDARGKKRQLLITERRGSSCVAAYDRPIYLETGARLALLRQGKELAHGKLGELPEVEVPLHLFPGDRLILTREDAPAQPATNDHPARVHCSLPEVFDQVRAQQAVWLDDGKIGGTIESVDGSELALRITHTDPQGARLRSEKGINFPDSELSVPALTPKDVEDLAALADDVDIVGLSFVRRPEDVELLHDHLLELGMQGTGVVLKIENRTAFQNLPRILLAALRYPPVGVMVARGDLAVEVGFERLSEVQEEILWICEAAHVPVIWATQVLERMTKTGRPSRAEVTDAAMSVRAECVMLNKGPHVVRAVDFLTGVLDRMHAHQSKKRAMLRPLSISRVQAE
jgi:pyruvate kinase